MSVIKYKIKYPCGLEVEIFAKSILMNGEFAIGDNIKPCPIHKDECKLLIIK